MNVEQGSPGAISLVSGTSVKITDGTYTASVRDTGTSDSLNVAIVDAAGAQITSFGGGTQYTEDDAAPANPVAPATSLVRQDTPATLTSLDGDIVTRRGTNYGAAYTQIVTSAGAFVDSFGGGTQYADGAARGTATGTLAMGDDGANIQSVKVDATGVLAIQDNGGSITIDAVSLPLPTGAATAALQTQPGVDIGDVTVNNGAAGAAVNIQDGGNSITVDGSVTVSATDLDIRDLAQATDSVAIGDGTDLVDILAAGTDDLANTTNQLVTASLLYAYDGTTFDRVTNGGGTEATALRVTVANDSTGLLSVDDNGSSLTVDNATLSVVGGGTEAAAMRVTIANDSTGVLSVDDNGSSLTVDGTVTVVGGAADGAAVSGNPVRIAGKDGSGNTQDLITDTTGNLSVGTGTAGSAASNVVTVQGIASGTALTVDTELMAAAALADGASATPTTPTVGSVGLLMNATTVDRQRAVVNALNSTGTGLAAAGLVAQFDDTAPTTVTENQFGNVRMSANGILYVGGAQASDVAIAGNPVNVGGRASTAVPTAVSADGDNVNIWTSRNGAPVVTMAPHVGLDGTNPWALVHEGVQFTTAQTSTVVVAGGASEKIVVTKVQLQAYATTSGTAILYFGTGAYSRGTNRAIFDGEFAPSATLKPGVIMDGPFISGTNGDDILFTSVGNLSITLSIWYYVVT